jgi:hypothetical protein
VSRDSDSAGELRTVAVALLATLLLWNLPYGGFVLYPFKLLATWLHEMSHALMMNLTGIGLSGVEIYRDSSGVAYTASRGGAFATAVVSAAGYMGCSLWGAVILVATPNAKAARRVFLLLAALMGWTAATVVIPVDGDYFGSWVVAGLAVAAILVALLVPARWRVAIAHFVAAQSCVNALLDIRVLLRPSQVVNGMDAAMASDAHAMAYASFGTTETWAVWTWAGIWLAWSLIVLYVALRVSGSRALATVVPFGPATGAPRDGSDRDERRHNPATAPDETVPSAPADTEGS